MRLFGNPDLILEQADVVVRSFGVELSLPLQVQLQSLHVEPEVSGVGITLRRITADKRHRGKDTTRVLTEWTGKVQLTCTAAFDWAGSDRSLKC